MAASSQPLAAFSFENGSSECNGPIKIMGLMARDLRSLKIVDFNAFSSHKMGWSKLDHKFG
jgi:hypothetical protein